MSRITKEIRDKIVAALIKHRFEARLMTIIKERAALAKAVYDDLYPMTIREKIAALPDGWIPTNEKMHVYFGTAYTSVYASGFIYGELNKVASVNRSDANFRLLAKHEDGCVKKYEATHALAIEHERLAGAVSDIKNEISEATRAAETAILKSATIKRLIEAWPEIEPFARQFNTEKPQLPALQTDALNAMLGLPVTSV